MPLISGKNKVQILAAILLVGSFLFLLNSKTAEAAWGDYAKTNSGTLTASDWNNLPADFLNKINPATMDGPLGINTSAPAFGLNVNGPIVGTSFGGSMNAAYISSGSFGSISSPGGNYFFAGNVGIGTTTSAYALSVGGDINFSGILRYNGSPFISSQWLTNGTSIYYNNGNVGVGTSSPSMKLQVGTGGNGNIMLAAYNSSSIGQGIIFREGFDPIGSRYNLSILTDNTLADGSPDGLSINAYEGVAFRTGNNASSTPKVYINQAGNVGIGTTTPTGKLHVVIPEYTTPIILQSISHLHVKLESPDTKEKTLQFTEGGILQWKIGMDNAGANSNYFSIKDTDDATPEFTIDTSGNIGIGTATPVFKLDVVGSGIRNYHATDPYLLLSQGTNNAYLENYSGKLHIQARSLPIYFETDSSYTIPKMMIGTNGNVGIGTTTPTKLLHVNGGGQFEDVVFGVSPGSTQNLALATVDYVNTRTGVTAGGTGGVGIGTSGQTLRHNGTSWVGNSLLYNNGTNIGVGTSSPLAKLHVVGTQMVGDGNQGSFLPGATLQIQKFAGAVTSLGFWQNGVASALVGHKANDSNFYITNNYSGPGLGSAAYSITLNSVGNVGVGTTNPIYNVDVLNATSATPTYSRVGLDVTTSTSFPRLQFGSLGSYIGYDYSGNEAMVLNPRYINSVIKFQIAGTEKVRIDKDGNVGINTTAPSQKLHVAGGGQFDLLSYGVTPGDSQTLALSTVEYVKSKVGGAGGIAAGITGQTLRHDGTGWIANSTIYNNGTNVGIGTTNPREKLDLSGGQITVDRGRGYYWYNSAAYDGAIINSGGDIGIYTQTDGSNARLTVKNSGNVGIGTTNPGALLHLLGASGLNTSVNIDGGFGGYAGILNMRLTSGGSGNDVIGKIGFYNNDGVSYTESLSITGYQSASNYDGYMIFKTRGSGGYTEKLRIQANGNVGINTTTPTQKLHVAGGAQFDLLSYGVTPGDSQTLALSTVEYVKSKVGGAGGIAAGTTGQTLRHDGTGWIANSLLFNNGTNVGIGTAAPGNKLSVSGADEAAVPVLGTNSGKLSITNSNLYGLLSGVLNNGNAYFQVQRIDATPTAYNLLLQPSGGNVGVGTAYPAMKLEAAGTSGLPATTGTTQSGALRVGYAGNVKLDMGTYGTSATGWLQVTNASDLSLEYPLLLNPNGGNVGVGTTNPRSKMEIGNGGTGGAGIGAIGEQLILYGNQPSILFDDTSATGNDRFLHINEGVLSIGRSTTTTWVATDFVIDSFGNVGINTTTPTQKLHVAGGAQFDLLSYGVTPGFSQTLALATVEFVKSSLVDGTGPWQRTAPYIYPSTLTDNIGIGVTNPSQLLEISKSASGAVGPVLNLTNPISATSSAVEMRFAPSSSFGVRYASIQGINRDGQNNIELAFLTGAGAAITEKMRINSGGYVGIGTTAPGKTLDIAVAPNASNGILVRDNNDATKSILITSSQGVTAFPYIGTNGNRRLDFGTNTARQMTIDTTGNVGVGTTNPVSKLHILGTGAGDSTWNQGILIENNNVTTGESALSFKNAAMASNYWFTGLNQGDGYSIAYGTSFIDANTKFRIASNGNVGINTTTPTQKLHVAGGAQFDLLSYGVTPGDSQTLALSTVEYVKSKVGGSAGVGAGTTGQTLRHNGTGWIADSTIYNNGTNVGIGTTNPVYKIDMNDGQNGIQSINAGMYNGSGTTGGGLLWKSNNTTYTKISAAIRQVGEGTYFRSGIAFFTGNNSDLITDATERMRINMDGNVGIGTTTPTRLLTVNGTGANQGFQITSLLGTRINYIGGRGSAGAEAEKGYFELRDNATPKVILDTNGNSYFNGGNVGVGIANPVNKLSVESTTRPQLRVAYDSLRYAELGDTSLLATYGGNNNSFSIGTVSAAAGAGHLIFKTQNLEAMRIDHLGNIGINTTTPTQKLHVAGGGQFDLLSYGVTPGDSQTLALSTVEYVKSKVGGSAGVGSGTSGQTLRHNGTGWIANSTIYNNGTNVGIGTTNPTYKLDIQDAALRIGETYENTGLRTINTLKTGEFVVPSYANGKDVVVFRMVTNNTANTLSFGGGTSVYDSPTAVNFYTGATPTTTGTEKMRIDASGNVGIGTTNPGSLLQISNGNHYDTPAVALSIQNGDTSIRMASTIAMDFMTTNAIPRARILSGGEIQSDFRSSYLSFYTNDSSGSLLERMRINSLGNVGIGTTTPTSNLYVVGSTNNVPVVTINHTGSNPKGLFVLGGHDSGDYSANFANQSGTSLMYIRGDGRIGIGTTNPSQKLHVAGTAIFDGLAEGITPGSSQTFALTTVEYVNTKVGGSAGVGTGTSGQTLRHNGTGWAADSTIYNNGTNVGIGTANPLDKLEINGDVGIMNSSKLSFGSQLINPPYIKAVWTDNNNTGLEFHTFAASVDVPALTLSRSTGYVGVGTTNPGAKLEVYSNASSTVKIGQWVDNSLYGAISLNGNMSSGANFLSSIANQNLFINRPTGMGIYFRENGNTDQMVIRTGGNVGINTTTPSQKLHVAGGIQLDAISFGVTPGASQTLALSTVEYVNAKVGGSGGIGGGTTGQTLRHNGTSWIANSLLYNNGTNIGIGTTTPLYKAEISGSFKASASSSSIILDSDGDILIGI